MYRTYRSTEALKMAGFIKPSTRRAMKKMADVIRPVQVLVQGSDLFPDGAWLNTADKISTMMAKP